jgi:Yip1 domain
MSYDANEEPPLGDTTPPPGGSSGRPPNPGYDGPPVTPLTLGEAIRQLPRQYVKVVTRPSAATFAEEVGKARWDVFWVQLLSLTILSILFGLLEMPFIPRLLQTSLQNSTAGSNSLSPEMVQMTQAFQGATQNIIFASVIVVPIFFLIGQGVYYLLARAFGGQGTFLAQGYTTLLFQTPLTIVSLVIGALTLALFILAPPVQYLGSLFSSALSIYIIVLQIFAIMAVHRLSGGRAAATVLIPLAALVVLSCILAFVIVFFILSAVLQAPH